MISTDKDKQFMHQALKLAQKGIYTAHPNPRVGCVIVKDDHIVGQGFHRRTGELHAESYALQMAGSQAKGATCYITLEPCAHWGRTGPCVEELVQREVKRVVIAMQDPNPIVNGKGVVYLQSCGIPVTIGVLQEEAERLNQSYCYRMEKGLPFVRAKIAASLDGNIAMASGESQWITGVEARQDVQTWRAQSGAILTGVNTIIQDNPRLTVRQEGLIYQQPLRVVCDSDLRTPLVARVLSEPGKTIVMITEKVPEAKRQTWYLEKGQSQDCEICVCPKDKKGHVDLKSCLQSLASREINEVLVETGPTLLGALIKEELVNELLCYIAPKILGDLTKPMMSLPFVEHLDQHIPLKFIEVKEVGSDLRIRARLNWGDRHANA